MDKDFELDELEFLKARDEVSDEELLDRMRAAPDMGGALLVELCEFVIRRAGCEPT